MNATDHDTAGVIDAAAEAHTDAEHRRTRRIPIDLDIAVILEPGTDRERHLLLKTLDYSARGLLLRSPQAIEPGTDLIVIFPGGASRESGLLCRTVHSRPFDERQYLVGVEFMCPAKLAGTEESIDRDHIRAAILG